MTCACRGGMASSCWPGLGLVAVVSVIGANWTASIPALMGATVLWLAFAAYVARSTPVLGRVRAALPRR